jgi:sugar/nucleoside kinase (ribokinase family)
LGIDKTWDVIGIGENSIDEVVRVPELPSAGAKMPIAGRRLSPGGQVATTLCACARLELRSSYIGAFGGDDNGTLIRRELERRGVHTGEALVRTARNRYALILVDERTGERAVLWERDVSLALAPEDVRAETIARTRLLHVDATEEACSIAAARAARQAGVRVTSDIDRITARTPELVEAVDVAIFAEQIPQRLTGDDDAERALRRVRARDAQWVCVTRGAGGALLLEGERVHRCPAFPVNAVDTTGAGDVFRAGFIYALLAGRAPEDILRFATAAAAASCRRPGAIESVPSLGEILDICDGGWMAGGG